MSILVDGVSSESDRLLAQARSIFRHSVRCFNEADTISVYRILHQTHITYQSINASCGRSDITMVRLCVDHDSGLMWIADLRVASPFRLNGVGRQLVEAAEALGHQMGIHKINVFPLTSSEAFWEKMSYTPRPGAARVLWKTNSVPS